MRSQPRSHAIEKFEREGELVSDAGEPQHEDIVAKMQRFYASIAAGEIDTVNAILAPDVIVHEAESLPYPGTFHGHAGFWDLMTKVAESWEDLEAKDFRFYINADGVLARLTLTAKSRATGEPFEQELIEAWTVKDGLLKEGRIFYFDTHSARRLAGNS